MMYNESMSKETAQLVQVRVPSQLKTAFDTTIESMGLTPSAGIRLLMQQTVNSGRIEAVAGDYLTAEAEESIINGLADYKAGRLKAYASVDEALDSLK